MTQPVPSERACKCPTKVYLRVGHGGSADGKSVFVLCTCYSESSSFSISSHHSSFFGSTDRKLLLLHLDKDNINTLSIIPILNKGDFLLCVVACRRNVVFQCDRMHAKGRFNNSSYQS